MGQNDCLNGFICPKRLPQVINLYIYLGTAGNNTVNTMSSINIWSPRDNLRTTWPRTMPRDNQVGLSNRPNRTWFVLIPNQMTIITQSYSLHNFQGIRTSSNQLPPFKSTVIKMYYQLPVMANCIPRYL